MMLDQENNNSIDQPKEEQKVVSTTTVTNTDQSMIASSIEAKADGVATANDQDKPKSFMSKKRIILTILFFVVSLVLVGLTIRYVLRIDWYSFFNAIRSGFDHRIGVLWFFLMIVAAFVNVLRTFITLLPRIRSLNCKISFGSYLLFGITVCFLGQVTPSSLITDPYTIFWMKTHGISTSKCASIIFTNTLFWQIGQIILVLPCLIIAIINRHTMWSYFINGFAAGKTVFWLIIIGVVIDYISLAFLFFMCISKSFHYRISCIFNWFKKKLHMKYHTKPEIVEKYKKNAVIRQDFICFMKDWKTSLWIFLLFCAGDIIATLSLCWAISFVQYVPVQLTAGGSELVCLNFDWGIMFVCGKLSVPANRLNLLPGAAMWYERSIFILIGSLNGWKELPDQIKYIPSSLNGAKELVSNNGIFMGRCFNGYLPALVGIGGFITLTIQQFRLSKKGKLTQNKY